MVTEIAPGIVCFSGIMGANSYAYQTGDEISIIDTGLPGCGKKIIGQIRDLGWDQNNVRQIILTHTDIDHCGSAAELSEITGAQIAVHCLDAPGLREQKAQRKVKGPTGLLLGMMKTFIRFKPANPDIILEDGDEVGGLSVIHCPGHTSGSICLLKSGVVLFAGDALLSGRKADAIGPSKRFSADIAQAWLSVKALSLLDYDILLPGHGKPVIHGASYKVKSLVENAL